MTVMLILSLIVSWPFTYADGIPVPVSAESIRKLGSTSADAILMGIASLDQQRVEIQAPFVAPSEAA